MAFNTITVGARTYNSIGLGEYSLSTLTFGSPQDRFKISPARKSGKDGPVQFSVTRVIEKDITVGTVVTRKRASVTVQFSYPDGFTAVEGDSYLNDIDSFLDVSNINRLLLGES